jgi:hypothetical protein
MPYASPIRKDGDKMTAEDVLVIMSRSPRTEQAARNRSETAESAGR